MNNNSKFIILNSNELLQVNGGEQTFGSVMRDIGHSVKKGVTEFGKTLVSDEFVKPFVSVVRISWEASSLIVAPLRVEKACYNIQKEWDNLSSYGN